MSDTIFMVHCMCGGAWTWENYKPFFEDRGYECVSTTLRYHDIDPEDEPDPLLGTTSLLDYAEDLEREIRLLDSKPVIMGHSMGGLLAQQLAARGLAKSLVLLAPAAPAGIFSIRPSVIKSFWSAITKWKFWGKSFRQTYDEAVYSMLHKLLPDDRKKTYNRFVYESGRAAFEIGFWYFDMESASRVDDAKVKCPILVVAGSEDRITPPSVVRKISGKYQNASTYKEFDGYGHWLVGEPGWEEVAKYIDTWLRE